MPVTHRLASPRGTSPIPPGGDTIVEETIESALIPHSKPSIRKHMHIPMFPGSRESYDAALATKSIGIPRRFPITTRIRS